MGGRQEKVLITDASNKPAQAVAAKLENNGMKVIRNYPKGLPEDVTKEEGITFAYDNCSEQAMQELLEAILSTEDKVDYLVHTDNIIFRTSIESITEEDFKHYFDLNAKSAFFTAKVFGQHMSEQGEGAIIFLSSVHDEKPTGSSFVYSTAKGAVKMLSKELALFYGRKNIRVNLIELDMTEEQEPLLDSLLTPFNYDVATKIPLRRMAQANDVTGAVAFLLSKEADFINGADIRIDGGHVLYYIDR